MDIVDGVVGGDANNIANVNEGKYDVIGNVDVVEWVPIRAPFSNVLWYPGARAVVP